MGQMKDCNVGGTDRILRMGVGFGLLGAAWLTPNLSRWARIGMLLAAAEAIYTGVTRHCPISEALGYSTCGTASAPLLGETLAAEVDTRYPEMVAEAFDERTRASAEKISLGMA
jgi:hypothetical protein